MRKEKELMLPTSTNDVEMSKGFLPANKKESKIKRKQQLLHLREWV